MNTRLNDARTPLFLLDHRRQVVFFNAGCEQLTGWKADEIVGQVCDYATDAAPVPVAWSSTPSAPGAGPSSPADGVELRPAHTDEPDELAALTGSLCPPPEVLAGYSQSVPAFLPHRDGRSLGRQIHFFPLVDADGRVESVLGLITPLDQPRPRIEPTPAQRLHAELASLRAALRQRFSLASIVCANEAMQRVLVQVNLARASLAPVALEGEPGTGKEHIARVIHYEGPLRTRSFVPLDCRSMAAIDLKLTLRRLLGDEAGQGDEGSGDAEDRRVRQVRADAPTSRIVTGASAQSLDASCAALPRVPAFSVPGLGLGTLYLANVECLPRDVQELLVTAFCQPTSPRASLSASSRPDAPHPSSPSPQPRLIVSTIGSLDALLTDETLRPDFYYLVTALRIGLPPLRRRPEDLAPLAQSFLEALNRGAEPQIGGFTDAVWSKFREYNWPGNLDELSAVIREARSAATQDSALTQRLAATQQRLAATQRGARDTEVTDDPTSTDQHSTPTEFPPQTTHPGPRTPLTIHHSPQRVPPSLITPDHLPFRFRTGLDAQSLGPRVEPRTMPLEPYLEQIEREHILAALEQVRFSKKKAADLLGMTRPRLYRRMQALGIEDRELEGTTTSSEGPTTNDN